MTNVIVNITKDMGLPMDFDFSIDEDNIHMELAVLPSKIFDAGQLVAETRRTLDERKRALEVLESQADSQVRNNPAVFHIIKVTEGAITAAIDQIPEVQEARNAVIDAKYKNDVAYAAANALDAKRKSLESIVQLKSIGYYAARSAA